MFWVCCQDFCYTGILAYRFCVYWIYILIQSSDSLSEHFQVVAVSAYCFVLRVDLYDLSLMLMGLVTMWVCVNLCCFTEVFYVCFAGYDCFWYTFVKLCEVLYLWRYRNIFSLGFVEYGYLCEVLTAFSFRWRMLHLAYGVLCFCNSLTFCLN